MPSIVPNALVEQTLRTLLLGEGYALTEPRRNGETGVDKDATRREESIHIECIGYKALGPLRAKDFYESFFRAVSRLNDGGTRLVIALAAQARRGLPQRAAQHRVAWARIADAFPELEIWLVDTTSGRLTMHRWGEWLEDQTGRALDAQSATGRESENAADQVVARRRHRAKPGLNYRIDTLRGRVEHKFQLSGDASWNIDRLVRALEAADDEFATQVSTPHGKFELLGCGATGTT